jgi:hypothetical protein
VQDTRPKQQCKAFSKNRTYSIHATSTHSTPSAI